MQVSEGITGEPPLVQLVVYNLPNRDCSAASSLSSWTLPEDIPKYKKWIDTIAAQLREYKDLRVTITLEPVRTLISYMIS